MVDKVMQDLYDDQPGSEVPEPEHQDRGLYRRPGCGASGAPSKGALGASLCCKFLRVIGDGCMAETSGIALGRTMLAVLRVRIPKP